MNLISVFLFLCYQRNIAARHQWVDLAKPSVVVVCYNLQNTFCSAHSRYESDHDGLIYSDDGLVR